MEETFYKLLEALGSAEQSLYLNYQHHINYILDLVDEGNTQGAKDLANAIIKEMSS